MAVRAANYVVTAIWIGTGEALAGSVQVALRPNDTKARSRGIRAACGGIVRDQFLRCGRRVDRGTQRGGLLP